MPWLETAPVEERVRFINERLRTGMPVARLCEVFGISLKTGWKWIARFKREGEPGLEDRSRAPHNSPQAIPKKVAAEILATKAIYPTWGPRKLLGWLKDNRPRLERPAASSVGDLFERHGLVKPRRFRHRIPARTAPFSECLAPNDIWCADFKGQFNIAGKACYPLTVSDAFSRYLLCCHGLPGPREVPVRLLFEHLFREFGLPRAIRTDNGVPFAAARAPAGLSSLSAWWARLGIQLERIDAGKPQQNGRHERMHLTLKQEAVLPPRSTMKAQQLAFDDFRRIYNDERPHEALGQVPPATIYCRSLRPYPDVIPKMAYPTNIAVRLVHQVGKITWNNKEAYVSRALAGELLGLEEVADGVWSVAFGPINLGLIDDRGRFVPVRNPSLRGSKRPAGVTR